MKLKLDCFGGPQASSSPCHAHRCKGMGLGGSGAGGCRLRQAPGATAVAARFCRSRGMRLPAQKLYQGRHRAAQGVYVIKCLTDCAVGPDLRGETSSIVTPSLCRALNESKTTRTRLSGAGFVRSLCDLESGSEARLGARCQHPSRAVGSCPPRAVCPASSTCPGAMPEGASTPVAPRAWWPELGLCPSRLITN